MLPIFIHACLGSPTINWPNPRVNGNNRSGNSEFKCPSHIQCPIFARLPCHNWSLGLFCSFNKTSSLGHHLSIHQNHICAIGKFLTFSQSKFHTHKGMLVIEPIINKRGVRREEARTFLFYDSVRDTTTRCDLKIPLCGGWRAGGNNSSFYFPPWINLPNFLPLFRRLHHHYERPPGRKRAPQLHAINNYQITNNNLLRLAGQE